MVNCWFGLVVWYEKDCYLGVPLESQTTNPNQQAKPLAEFKPLFKVTFTNCQNVEFLEGNPCSFVLAPGETMSKSVLRQKEPGPSKYNLRVHCKGAYTGEEDAKEIGFFLPDFSCFFRGREGGGGKFLGCGEDFSHHIFCFNLGFSAVNWWFGARWFGFRKDPRK